MADHTAGRAEGSRPDSVTGEVQARRSSTSARSRRGLDWLVFFVADIQTGFGPFVAVFLTSRKWTQLDIGLVLTVSSVVSLIGLIPLGALVDAVHSLRRTIAIALAAIGVAALAFAAWPIFPVVMASRVLHAIASSVAGLSIVALSVRLVEEEHIGERLGRNAAFASAGTAIAAAAMGGLGYFLPKSAVFYLAAILIIPALIALSRIRPEEIAANRAARRKASSGPKTPLSLARLRPLAILAACLALFHLANASMLPLAASLVTLRSDKDATLLVAAAMLAPQLMVTVLSPFVGRTSEKHGRRPLLLLGFAALAVRAFLFTEVHAPHLLVLVQTLDGISAAALGVLVPLVIADVTLGSHHFNLAQGTLGCAMGIGASISTTLSGFVADHYGTHDAFMMLSAIAVLAFIVLAIFMPETRPRSGGLLREPRQLAADEPMV